MFKKFLAILLFFLLHTIFYLLFHNISLVLVYILTVVVFVFLDHAFFGGVRK